MKYLFVKPVSYVSSTVPLCGIPSLLGVLENEKINCEYIDLDSVYLKSFKVTDFLQYLSLLNEFYKNAKNYKIDLYLKAKLLSRKNRYYKNYLWLQKNIKNFEIYRALFENSELMYSYIYFYYYISLTSQIKEAMFLFDYDLLFEENNIINIGHILAIINSSFNNLKSFYNEQTEKLLNKAPDIIGIQITTIEDVLSAFSLAYLLKQKNKNIHINIGGNFFETNYKKIQNIKDLFGIFFDTVSIGDSTQTVIEIIKYLKKEIPIEDVNSLLHLKNETLVLNKISTFKNINKLPFQSFTGYKKENYLSPKFILPIRASTTYSCYWGKCLYCTCSASNQKYRLTSAERLVEEIEYLSKKYNTRYFAFWDNALPPKYLEKVSDLLIEKNLNIKYTLYLRLEEEFTFEILKKIKKSGCIVAHWGLDSASQRICDYINKGINVENAKLVLKASNQAGIYNFVYFLFGYPTETKKDIEESFNFIKKNRKNIDEVLIMKDLLFLDGSLLNEKEKYYKSLINNSDDLIRYKEKIVKKMNKIMKTTSNLNMIWSWDFLYIEKYGIFRFKILKRIVFYFFENKKIKKILNPVYKFVIKNAKNKIKTD